MDGQDQIYILYAFRYVDEVFKGLLYKSIIVKLRVGLIIT